MKQTDKNKKPTNLPPRFFQRRITAILYLMPQKRLVCEKINVFSKISRGQVILVTLGYIRLVYFECNFFNPHDVQYVVF